MGRVLFLLVVLAGGFYVGWPAFSAYQLHSGLTGGDPQLVAQKVDFASVRESLKPAVEAQVRSEISRLANASGSGTEQIVEPMVPQITEQVLATVVTPENAVRLAQGTGTVTQRVQAMVREQVQAVGSVTGGLIDRLRSQSGGGQRDQTGGFGALSGLTSGQAADRVREGLAGTFGADQPAGTPPAETAPSGEAGDTSFGFANIKSFEVTGPLSFAIGVAQDTAAAEPDVTAEIGFREFDWKLIGLRPNT